MVGARLCPDRRVGADSIPAVLSAADTATTRKDSKKYIPNQPVNPFSAIQSKEADPQQPGPVYQGYPNDQSFHQDDMSSKKPRMPRLIRYCSCSDRFCHYAVSPCYR